MSFPVKLNRILKQTDHTKSLNRRWRTSFQKADPL